MTSCLEYRSRAKLVAPEGQKTSEMSDDEQTPEGWKRGTIQGREAYRHALGALVAADGEGGWLIRPIWLRDESWMGIRGESTQTLAEACRMALKTRDDFENVSFKERDVEDT